MLDNENFAIFIVTNKRPDRVYTYDTLQKLHYSGRIVIVIDNLDPTIDEYKSKFGDMVYVFDKEAAARITDVGDNFGHLRGVVFARNACWDIARKLGIQYFMVLDDDYIDFRFMRDENHEFKHRSIDDINPVIYSMLKYYKNIPALSIAMAQTGDFIGGATNLALAKPQRKCMNSFICSVDRPFQFYGRLNEDVSAYVTLSQRGGVFLTIVELALQQIKTQTNSGGLTELYLDSGTYVKSFYSVMYHPSGVKISVLRSSHTRIHHKIKKNNTYPCILDEHNKKAA